MPVSLPPVGSAGAGGGSGAFAAAEFPKSLDLIELKMLMYLLLDLLSQKAYIGSPAKRI
jgi:hypothetical protein